MEFSQVQLHILHCIISYAHARVPIYEEKRKTTLKAQKVFVSNTLESTVWEAKEGSAVIKCQTNTKDSSSTNV